MPKIPVYQTSADYRPPRGDVEAAGAPGRMLAKFGEAVGEFGGKIADTVAAREKAAHAAQATQAAHAAAAENQRAGGTAKAMASLRQTIEQFEAEANPDAVMRRYWEQADAVGQDIFAGIRDKGARAQVEADYGNLARVQAALLQGDSLRRLAEQGRGDLQRNLGLYADVAAGARHPVEHDDAVALALREIQGKADAGFITAEDAGRIEQSFYGDLAGRQAQRAIAADPQAALDSLKGGEDFAGLDADARARLTAEAERAVQAQAVRAQTEQAAVRRDTQVRLPGYLDALRDGEAPDDTRFGREALAATLGAAEGGRRWAEIEEAQRFGQAMAKVKWATPDDIAGLTGRAGDASPALQIPPGAPGSLDGHSEQELLQRAVERRNQRLWSKPADYALNNPRVAELHAAMAQASAPPQPADAAAALQGLLPAATGQPAEPPPMLSPENRRAAIAAYANGLLAEQERLGVPEDRRQVLPEDMAHDAVRDIAAGDPANADQRLRDLAADWGADWPRVLDDLKRAGLPRQYALLAGLDNPVAREGFARVLAAQATEPGALRAKAGSEADAVDKGLADALAPMKASVDGGNIVLAMGPGGIAGRAPKPNIGPPSPKRTYDGAAYPRRNPVDLHDIDGKPVMSIDKDGNPTQVQVPQGVDLRMFAKLGEEDRKIWSEAGRGSIGDRLEYVKERLLNFEQGGIWDLQRPRLQPIGKGGHINYPEFVNAATIAIGIYCAALGLPQYIALEAQRAYAVKKSGFGDAKRHWYFFPLPERNVKNTEIGYSLYEDGLVPGPAE